MGSIPTLTRRFDDPATRYARDVVAGEVAASKQIRKVAARHLEEIQNPPAGFAYEPERWEEISEWCKTLTILNNAGDEVPYRLLEWQDFALGLAVGWVTDKGYPRYREVSIEVARGAGKTVGILGWVLHTMMYAKGAQIAVVCKNGRHAVTIWGAKAAEIVQLNGLPMRANLGTSDPGVKNPSNLSSCGFMIPRPGNLQGLTAARWILDEFGEHESHDWQEAVWQGAGKNPRCQIISITTPPMAHLASGPYMRKRLGWEKANDENDPRTLCLWWSADAGLAVDDKKGWNQAYPAMGELKTIHDYEEEYRRAVRDETIGDFETRQLCRFNTKGGLWVPGEWLERAELKFDPLELFAGQPCWVGLDCSMSYDMTAIAAIWGDQATAIYAALWHFLPRLSDSPAKRMRYGPSVDTWEELENVNISEGPRINFDAVSERLHWLNNKFQVKSIQYDTYAGRSFDAISQIVNSARLPMVRCGQMMRDIGPATTKLRSWLVCDANYDPVLRINPDPVFRFSLGCVRLKRDDMGNTKITKAIETGSVDCVAALIQACKGYEDDKAERSVAEDPGFAM